MRERFPDLRAEWIRTRYWSADERLLDDWEQLPPFQDMPPVGSVVAPLAPGFLDQALPPRTERGRYGTYNTSGFAFSTAYSRAAAEYWRLRAEAFDAQPTAHDIRPSLLEPFIEVIAWQEDRRPPAGRRGPPPERAVGVATVHPLVPRADCTPDGGAHV